MCTSNYPNPALKPLPLKSRPAVFVPTTVARPFSSANAATISPVLDVCSFTRIISLAGGEPLTRGGAPGRRIPLGLVHQRVRGFSVLYRSDPFLSLPPSQ